MKRFLAAGILVLAMACPALADGKFYVPPETVPPDLPYQRAFIAHDGSRELLILQSKYEGEAKDFGWVVPVPGMPEVATMDSYSCDDMFNAMGEVSKPRVQSIKKLVLYAIFIVGAGFVVLLIAKTANRSAQGKGSTRLFFMGKSGTIIFIILLLLFGSYLFVGSILKVFLPIFSLSGDVGIFDEKKVGIYDVTVLKSGTAEGLMKWLASHNYQCGENDRAAFDKYVRQNMYFVAARVNPTAIGEDGEETLFPDGLTVPLVLVFDSQKPFYPLALTGTIGKDVAVLLYVFCGNKLTDASGRMPLEYYGMHDVNGFIKDTTFIQNALPGSFSLNQKSLNKFKARLTPGQMKEDLVLENARDNEPYRATEYRWEGKGLGQEELNSMLEPRPR
jgi:hypothetical protein